VNPPLRVNHRYHTASQKSDADRPGFTVVLTVVGKLEGHICKDFFAIGKIQTPMFQGGLPLGLVPFKPHIDYYIDSCGSVNDGRS
jgi:hypothetical protein